MGLLGHAGLVTTQRYLTTQPDHLRGAVAADPVLTHVHTSRRVRVRVLDAPDCGAVTPPRVRPGPCASRNALADVC